MTLRALFCVISALLYAGCQATNTGTDLWEGDAGDESVPEEDAGDPQKPDDDAGSAPPLDTGTPPRDAGTPPRDTGTPPRDTGTPPRDTGVDVPVDRGNPVGNCPTTPALGSMTAPSFPGAEGFGAVATGGRGGRVCVVTTTATSGAGSLQACLDQTGPRTVVFRTSGVIRGPLNLRRGDVTIAGQTSPGGIIISGGFYCDNIYDRTSACQNVVMRHLRLRRGDDALRLAGTNRFIIDHCSFENASDESIEISRSHDVTVQYSVIAEPIGDHFRYAGILINYSKSTHPLDRLSIHHNVWNGCYGRLPEISCEENGDGPGTTNCAGRRIMVEVSNNLYFDVSDPIWYNRCVGAGGGNDCSASSRDFLLGLNLVGNVMHRRRLISEQPMFVNDVFRNRTNEIFWTANLMTRPTGTMGTGTVALPSLTERLAHPPVTIMPTATLMEHLQANAGAFPRDTMDTRLAGYLSAPVDSRPAAWSGGNGIDRGDGLRVTPPTTSAPTDTDGDGMPDAWETARGLNPQCAGASLVTLSARSNNGVAGCTPGYTDLECYLNELAAQRVRDNR